MEKVRLGKTNLVVTRLGWGGIPIQRVEEREAVSVIRAAIGMGVDLIDTARGYTDSEHKIGLALKGINRPVVLSTKSQVRTADIYNEVHKSLVELQVERINIYNLHGVSSYKDYETAMGPGGAYEGLLRAQGEGLIDHIGLTSHSLDVLERVLEEDRFAVVMTCYSFLEPDAAKRIFPLAKAKDVGVLAMKTFSGGVIEYPGPALRYVLSVPGIVPIPGSETIEKLRENWTVFASGDYVLTEADKKRIEAIQGDVEGQFCRRCDYCQPCTEGIPIQALLGLKSFMKRFGPQAQELAWVKGFIEKARDCSRCGECLPRCPYGLPIPDLMEQNLAWYDDYMTKGTVSP